MKESKGIVFASMALCLPACSGRQPGFVPEEGTTADASTEAAGGPSGAAFAWNDSGALQAHIQVNGSDLACGACAVLVAQAAGGAEPYTYQWSDPSLSGPAPTVCPTKPTHYSVVVTDSSGTTTGEIHHAGASTTASADLACSMTSTDAHSDAFAGCTSTAQEMPEPCPFDADAGVSDVHSTAVLLDVVAGQTYQFSYDQVLPFALGAPVTVDVYGALERCGQDAKLFTLTLDGRWHQAYCFTAKEAFKYSTSVVHDNGVLSNFDLSTSGTACGGCTDGGTPP
jgi:hypothetical protein